MHWLLRAIEFVVPCVKFTPDYSRIIDQLDREVSSLEEQRAVARGYDAELIDVKIAVVNAHRAHYMVAQFESRIAGIAPNRSDMFDTEPHEYLSDVHRIARQKVQMLEGLRDDMVAQRRAEFVRHSSERPTEREPAERPSRARAVTVKRERQRLVHG